jgi:hypothetical protein
MARTQQVRADIFATAEEIARGFLLLARDVDRRERPGPIQDGQVAGVALIGFDAIAWPPRNQRRRDHVARDALLGQGPLQLEPTRARLVAAPHGTVARDPFYESKNRLRLRRERVDRRCPLAR